MWRLFPSQQVVETLHVAAPDFHPQWETWGRCLLLSRRADGQRAAASGRVTPNNFSKTLESNYVLKTKGSRVSSAGVVTYLSARRATRSASLGTGAKPSSACKWDGWMRVGGGLTAALGLAMELSISAAALQSAWASQR